MNKLLFVTAIALGTAGPSIAQGHHQAPETVRRSFQRDYPGAQDPQWTSTNGQWNANFTDHSSADRGEMVAHYDRSGRHVDSHIPYDQGDVPQAIVDRAQTRYPGASGYDYTRIERPDGQPLFQVSLRAHGRHHTLYMDERGRERKYDDHH